MPKGNLSTWTKGICRMILDSSAKRRNKMSKSITRRLAFQLKEAIISFTNSNNPEEKAKLREEIQNILQGGDLGIPFEELIESAREMFCLK